MVSIALAMFAIPSQEPPRPFLEAARKAGIWIEAQDPSVTDPTLYSGAAGVLVFLSELAAAEPSAQAKASVDRRARALFESSKSITDPGLYTGLSGVAFALECAHLATGKKEHRAAAVAMMDRLVAAAKPAGAGVEWNDSRDVISGTAGIGCTLLWAAAALGKPDFTSLARRAGDRLLELAQAKGEGLAWSMSQADEPRMMPNFSHGTAGVAYFLSQLGRATQNPKYTEAARKGAAHLIAETNSEGLIYHHEPGGRDLCYLGWCHGPVGTSRLFASLHVSTDDPALGAWIDQAAGALLKIGIPEKRTPGYWNNYGLCCGDAGVLRFFLDLYRLDKHPEQIAFARRLGEFLIAKGEPSDGGLMWTFAENRVSPGQVASQTGLMQGAAGVGLALLWLDGFDQKRSALVRMPDAPWRW